MTIKKPTSLILTFACCVLSHVTAQEISSLAQAPATGVNINQSTVTNDEPGGVSVRYLNESQRRGASQTFEWNTNGKMTGFGIKISAQAAARYPLRDPQKFEIAIHEISNPLHGRLVVNRLALLPVTLDASLVKAGHYLYFTLATPLPLKKYVAYGFHIRPVELVDGNHLHLAWGKGAETYQAGVASMTLGIPYNDGDGYGREPAARDFDLVFFTTSERSDN